jgi:hypothetical protein
MSGNQESLVFSVSGCSMKFVIVSATVLVSSLHFVIVSSDKKTTGGKVLVSKDRSDWSSTSFYNVASIDYELPYE